MQGNERLFYDDTKSLGDLIAANWELRRPSTVIYYKENTDPNAHNFREDEVAVFINEGEAKCQMGGISYDSVENLKKNMYIYVSSLKRENTADVINEVMRILVKFRLYSFNDWDMITVVESRRIIPAYRYFQWMLKVELKDVYKPYGNPVGCLNRISKE